MVCITSGKHVCPSRGHPLGFLTFLAYQLSAPPRPLWTTEYAFACAVCVVIFPYPAHRSFRDPVLSFVSLSSLVTPVALSVPALLDYLASTLRHRPPKTMLQPQFSLLFVDSCHINRCILYTFIYLHILSTTFIYRHIHPYTSKSPIFGK